jgi:hypothetical protein
MKRIAAVSLLTLLFAACAPITISITVGGTPTSTPTSVLPTYTPISHPSSVSGTISTLIPAPTFATATKTPLPTISAPAAQCIAWTEAAAHVGETTCVRGTVVSTNASGSTFFIDFDKTRASFYAVSFKYTFDDVRGKCVEISGKISPYNGRPQIIIDSKEQLKVCAN